MLAMQNKPYKTYDMNRIITLLILMLFALCANSQLPFKVITVNGEIIATKANVTLQNGVEVYSNDNFDFRKPNSRAAMINSEKGRIVLTEQNATDAFSKAAFAPSISAVSSRSASMVSQSDLKNYFSSKLLVIDALEVNIGSDLYPLTENSFFFVRYSYNGETINKRLSFTGNKIVIDKAEILTVDGKPITLPEATELSLYYYKKGSETPESVYISSFQPNFVSTSDIKPEVAIIVEEFKGKPSDAVIGEVYDYLTSFYGSVDKQDLEIWVKKEFGL
jgi:hypothetical protein